MAISTTLINSLPLFEGVSDEDKQEFCAIGTLRSVPTHTVLGRSGEIQESVGYVISGQLQLKELADDGRVVSLSVVGPGTLLGWLAIVDPQFTSQEVICLTNCQLLTMPIKALRPLAQSNAVILNRLLQLSVASLKSARQERMMLTLPSAFQRICFQISSLSSQADSDWREDVSALPKQHDLASAANTTRETVSRTLQLLIKAGIISKVGHKVVVKRRDLLKRLAYDGPESLQSTHRNTPSGNAPVENPAPSSP